MANTPTVPETFERLADGVIDGVTEAVGVMLAVVEGVTETFGTELEGVIEGVRQEIQLLEFLLLGATILPFTLILTILWRQEQNLHLVLIMEQPPEMQRLEFLWVGEQILQIFILILTILSPQERH